MPRQIVLPLVCWLAVPLLLAHAHYSMLLPSTSAAKKGEEVAFTYQWGHPFEHQLFDAPRPSSVFALAPDGKKVDLISTIEQIKLPAGEGKMVVGWKFAFTPKLRGDYVVVLNAAPVWMEEEGEFFLDQVKVVLHVQAQKGWDALGQEVFEFRPLTRPYGLLPGMVFQAQLHQKPAAGAVGERLVEVERYNATAPKDLPADELITRTARTDPNGVVTTTLTEPGWWCLATGWEAGKREREGKQVPVRQRAILWVFVAEKTGI
jgi:uncharacterized GH25 family protein